MVKATLVAIDVNRGDRFVHALESAGIRVSIALGAVFPEYEDWRLVFASKDLDDIDLSDAYLKVHRALKDAGISVWETPPIILMKTNSPFVKALRKIFAKKLDFDVRGLQLGGRTWGDRYVDDAYAYKIA